MRNFSPPLSSPPSMSSSASVTRLKPSRGVCELARELRTYKEAITDANVELLDIEDLLERITKDVEVATEEAEKSRTLITSQKSAQEQRESISEETVRRLQNEVSQQLQNSRPPVGSYPAPHSTSSSPFPNPYALHQNSSANGASGQWGAPNNDVWPPQPSNPYQTPYNSNENSSRPPHYY